MENRNVSISKKFGCVCWNGCRTCEDKLRDAKGKFFHYMRHYGNVACPPNTGKTINFTFIIELSCNAQTGQNNIIHSEIRIGGSGRHFKINCKFSSGMAAGKISHSFPARSCGYIKGDHIAPLLLNETFQEHYFFLPCIKTG